MDAVEEIKSSIARIGEANEAFRKALDEVKKADVVTDEKLARIEKSLDSAIEAKSRIEARLDAEKKEREDLELRLSRKGRGGDDSDAETERKTFNGVLAATAMERGRTVEQLSAEQYADYRKTFAAMLRKSDKLLTADEIKTLSVGSDPDGGYLVTPDVSGRIVTKIYESSPIRQIALVQPIGTDALEGIEDLGEAGAGYADEHSTSGDATTPQIGRWRIGTHTISTEPKATQQLLDDASVDVEAWLAGKAADKFARFESAEFCAGAANRIRGIFLGYTAAADSGAGVTWGQIGYVATGQSADFATSNPADKMFDLIGTVKNEYLGNARFLTRRSVITKIRKFKDGQGNYLWQPSFVQGQPEMIAGYPVTRAEDVPALASNSYSLAFGDFRAAYQIVDRQGVRVLRDPYTAKPLVKFYTTKRVGGGMVNFEAIKLMKFGAS